MNQDDNLGFAYCVTGQSTTFGNCLDLYLGTFTALLLLSLCAYQIIIRVINQKRFLKKKQLLFMIILVADLCTIHLSLTFAYLLYFYFDQCFLIFLVYFFTKKATTLNVYNQNKTKLIRCCAYGLFAFFSILLITDIVTYYHQQNQKCSYIMLFAVRIVELVTSIVFVIGAYFLNKKMNALIIEQMIFNNRMTENEKVQLAKTRTIKWKFWTLVSVTVFGYVIQWAADLAYFVHYHEKKDTYCRLPAYNNIFKWWADLLICLFGYFLPLFCAVYLFWYRKKTVLYVVGISLITRNPWKWKAYHVTVIVC